MYDIVTYSTNDGYTGRFTNKDPRPDFYITYDTKWIDIAVELEAPIDITTLRGWTLNDEFFFGYDLGPGVENSQGIVTRKKLYTSQIKARLFIREDELTEHRRIDVCISTVVCRDLERLRVGEWIFFDNPDICFTLYLTELAPEVPESADSIGPDPIIDICPQIFACYGNIDSADINDLRVGPNIELDSDGIKAQDSDEGPSVKVDPSGVESKNPDPDNNKESKQSPEGLKAKDNNSGNEANYGADGMGFGSPGPGGGAGGSSGGLGSGAGPGGGPGLGLDGPGGSAALGPEGLGFGPPGAGGEGFASFGPEGMGTPPYKFSKDGIEYPEEGASIKFNPDAETPGWEFNPPLPTTDPASNGNGGGDGGIPGLPSGQPGQMLSYRPPLDPSKTNPTDPSKSPRFEDDLPTGHFMDYPLKPGRFVWGEEALEEEKKNIPASQFPKMTPEKKEELFNSWPGFSQSPTAGNETNPEFPTLEEPYPPAGTQPFSPADAAAWGYDPTSDTLKNDNPTNTFAGMTSPKGYNGYELEATLSSDTPTDGPIAVVAAEIKDPITGKTNNISAVRRPKTLVVTEEMDENNEAPYETPSWGLVYNYGQPDEKWFETDNSVTSAAPATTEPGFPGASHDDWVNAGPTKVRVVKEPDGIYAETSQFGSDELDPETGQYIAFESEPELEQFNNKKTGFGFGSKDQPAKVSDIKFETPDVDNHIVDVKNNQIYAYVPDNPDDLSQAGVESSGYYNLDSSFGVDDVFGDGRLLFNDRTKELFWSDPENKLQLARYPDQRLYLGNPIMEFQGTGANNNQDAYLRLNDEKNVDPVDSNLAGYETQTPGLRLTTFDSSGEFIGGQTYNTNEDPAASDNLATAINNMNKGDIGVLTSQDAYEGEITPSLKDTAFANGLYKLYNTKTDGVQNTPYASIFQKTQPQITPDGKTLKPAKSFEATDQNTAGDLPARIKAGITNGTFYTYGPEKPNALVSFDQAPYAWIDSNKDLWAENRIMADGGRMRDVLFLKEGVGGGLSWDNNEFGGAGDTAKIYLENEGGENQALVIKVTNDSADVIRLEVPDLNGVKQNGFTNWHEGNHDHLIIKHIVDNSGINSLYFDSNTNELIYDNSLILGNPRLEIQGSGTNDGKDPYLRWNGNEELSPASYEDHASGLSFTILDSAGEFIGRNVYDTSAGTSAANSLASAIEGMNPRNIGILTSNGSYGNNITKRLKDVAFSNGLYKLYNSNGGSPAYAAIFQKNALDVTSPDDKIFRPSKSFEISSGGNGSLLPANIKAGIYSGTFYVYGPGETNALVSANETPYAWIDSNEDLWAENGIMADGGRMRSQLVAAFGWGEGIGWDEDRILAVAEDSIDSSNSLIWGYLSHDSTNTYPARPTDDASAWTISPSGNTIGLELRNNLSFVGLTQEDETTTYSTAATLSSTDSSPVAIGLIIAAVEDGGREYTLSAMRSMGIVDPLSGYGIYYNYNQSDERLISSKNIAAVNPLKWSGNGPVRLQYSKNPSEVKVITSQNNSVIIDSSTEININLTDDPDLIKFTTATKGGFGGLREFVSRTYQNGAFDDPSYTVSGSTASLSGWTVELEQTRLGIDAIGGITSPSDPTPNPPGGGGRLSPGDAELHPSMSYYWQYLTKDATIGGAPLGKNCVRMYSSGTVVTGGAIAHGPHLISNDYLTIPAGTNIGFSWRAAAGGDAYDVIAYLLRDDGYTEILLNTTQQGASGDTGWLRVNATVNQTGNYKFVFVSGTFDYTFGRAAGASLFVTEVDVEFPASGAPIQVTFSDIQHAKEKVVPAPLDEDSNANGVRIHVKEDLKSGGVGHHLYIENDNFCDLDEITIISGKINLISCKDDGQIYIDGNKVIHKGNLESSLSQIPALAPVLNPTAAEEIENPFTVITAPTIGGNNQLIYDSTSNTLQFEPLQSTDEIPEGENNIFFTDSRVFNYLTTNNYYTESAVINYLTTNNYYTESAVNNYLVTNNYYTESAVNNYLITNNYYTESDVTDYVDTAVLEYTLDAEGESGGVKLSLLADGSPISDIHFTGGPNILISYVPDFYKPEQIYFEAIGLDYRLRGTEVTDGVKFTLLRDDEFATDSFQIIGEGLIDVSWDSNQKIVSLSVDSADIISLINQYGSGLDSGEVITLIEGYNYLDSGNVINIIESYNILDSADVIAISGTPISYLEDLLDVSNAPGDSGDYLKWNGTEWEPSRGDSYQLLSNSPGYNSAKIYLNQLSEGGAYPNSTFSDTTQTVSGNQVTMNGWIAIRSQVRLGIDAIGGFTTPIDPTPNPVGDGGQVSPGDGTLDPSMNFYSEFTTLGGKDCIRLYSSGNVSTFGDVSHGPYLISQDYSYFAQGSTVAFSWRAAAGGDAYDVFAYLLKDDGTYQILLNETQGGTSGDTGWLTVSETVAQSGNYKFVFVSGTFDYSFGGLAGASLYVTDVKTEIGTEAGGVNINGGTGILVTHTAPNTITITNTGSGSGSGGLDSASINDLGDVNTSGATTGDVLEFDGTNWVPGTGGALYTAGDGIVLSSFSFSVDTTVLRTNASQTITAGKKFNDGIILQFGTGGDMDMYHNATNNIIDLRNGDLLIREYTTVGTTKFTFGRSTGDFTAAGDITAFSDERLKSDIKTLDNSLEKVKLLRGVSYTKDGKPGIGLIAQEVEKVLPEVVHQSDEFKAVAYGNIIGVLIEAVKELSSRVEKLERDR